MLVFVCHHKQVKVLIAEVVAIFAALIRNKTFFYVLEIIVKIADMLRSEKAAVHLKIQDRLFKVDIVISMTKMLANVA